MKVRGKADEAAFYPVLAATIANLIWGFSNAFTRIAMEEASVYHTLAIRFLLGTLALTFIAFLQRAAREAWTGERKKQAGKLFWLGFVDLVYFFCETYGIELTNVTCAGVVLAVSPIVSMIFAAFFLREYPTGRQVFFSFVAVIGVIMITVSEGISLQMEPVGFALLAGGAVCAGVLRVINRKVIGIYSTLERTYAVVGVSAIGYTIMAFVEKDAGWGGFFRPFGSISFVMAILVLGIGSSVGANMLANYAAAKLPIVKLSVFGTICTLCSMTGGILFLGEPLTWISALGAGCILIGIQKVNT